LSASDASIIARVLDGDADAYSELVRRYYAPCARFAFRMLGNRQDAEDAVQEAFLRAYRALGRYRERDLFRSWLYRILANQCRSAARRRHRHEGRLDPDADPSSVPIPLHTFSPRASMAPPKSSIRHSPGKTLIATQP